MAESAVCITDIIEDPNSNIDLPELNTEDPRQANQADGNFQSNENVDSGPPNDQDMNSTEPVKARFDRTCPSVVKGEPCWALSKGKTCHYASHEPPGLSRLTHLYICHLPDEITEDGLEELFRPYGDIDEVKVLLHPRTNRSRGAGFVHFKTHKDAASAVEGMNGVELPNSDKPIEVRFARPRDRGRRGRGRGRGWGPPRGGFGWGPPRGRGGGWGPPRGYGWDVDGYGGGWGEGGGGWGGYGPQRPSRGGGRWGRPYSRGSGGGGRGRGYGGPSDGYGGYDNSWGAGGGRGGWGGYGRGRGGPGRGSGPSSGYGSYNAY